MPQEEHNIKKDPEIFTGSFFDVFVLRKVQILTYPLTPSLKGRGKSPFLLGKGFRVR